jgi:DNA modification methylase
LTRDELVAVLADVLTTYDLRHGPDGDYSEGENPFLEAEMILEDEIIQPGDLPVVAHDTFGRFRRVAREVDLPHDDVPTYETVNDGITLIKADTRRIPLPDDSVDLVVTSPPYWAQRSYTDAGGQHYSGQIGDEPTPDMYIDNMIAATREWMRLVKPTGSIWVNLGDKYARTGGVGNDETPGWDNRERGGRRATKALGAPEKSLIGLPWRYALRCIDELGLILRQEVIWSKPNGMPESVTDRPRRSHEQWFFFTKEPRYYSAVDRVRDEYAPNTAHRYATSSYGPTKRGLAGAASSAAIISSAAGDGGPSEVNPLGKLPPSVWQIPTQGLIVPEELGVDHYAAFPMECPRRIIQGWSPAEVCTVCGEGRRPVKTSVRNGGRIRQKADNRFLGKPKPDGSIPGGQDAPGAHAGYVTSHTIVGEACACTPYTDHPGVYVGVSARAGEPLVPGNTPRSLGAEAQGPWREYHLDDWDPPATRKAVVLDPFGGTGTTALVADVLGRNGVHVDMSADYLRIAEWRTTDPGQRASAMLVPRPVPPMPGQLDLFGGGNPYDMANSYAEEHA